MPPQLPKPYISSGVDPTPSSRDTQSKCSLTIAAPNHRYWLAIEGEGKLSLGLNLSPCNEVNLEESRANSWGEMVSSGMNERLDPAMPEPALTVGFSVMRQCIPPSSVQGQRGLLPGAKSASLLSLEALAIGDRGF